MKCPKCGKKVSKAWLSKTGECPNCGAKIVTRKGKLIVAALPPKKAKPSSSWYLVALFGMIVGGVIGYLRVKDRNREMAGKLLVLGILTTIIAAIKIMWFFAPEMLTNIWVWVIVIAVLVAAKLTFAVLVYGTIKGRKKAPKKTPA